MQEKLFIDFWGSILGDCETNRLPEHFNDASHSYTNVLEASDVQTLFPETPLVRTCIAK